ncbi:MAG: hypothetical protein GWO00_05420 [Gemmatimonadetes bacterium]|nr:hypothetical protein [Gemmatimonadota bacterium]NIR77833.1 hypothetical protein [Gemmatimonadota bacterium]NIT86369.1 hypothetical protein [Gemmatimonadota bacterium]NIU30206.1 hypothetical protein [Gemmatimonadota bacterium]NIV60601.1 hypothetical protein [Gemmatimonadota bacterium]
MSGRSRSVAVVAILLSLVAGPGPAGGQVSDRAPLLLQLPSGTPAVAFGGAVPLAEASSDAVFAHPGTLGRARGVELGAQTWEDGATGLSASGALEWWDGAAGLGVRTLSYRLTSPLDSDPALRAEDGLFDGAGPVVSEHVAAVGYGRELVGIHAGVVGKWIERRIAGERAWTAAADVGVAAERSDVVLGLAARNLGPALERGGEEIGLPREVVAGASFSGAPVGPLDLGAAAQLTVRADGEVVPAGGLEVAWWPVLGRTFVGRVGLRRVPEGEGDPVSFGAAFHGDAFGLEYAYRGFDGSGASHLVGIRWREDGPF